MQAQILSMMTTATRHELFIECEVTINEDPTFGGLNSIPRAASKMHQSAGLHKESKVCRPCNEV